MDTAKIFQNGRSFAVRLPKEYRFKGNEVYVKKLGDIVMLIPKESGWSVMEDSIDYFTSDFMNERNQPEVQKRDEMI